MALNFLPLSSLLQLSPRSPMECRQGTDMAVPMTVGILASCQLSMLIGNRPEGISPTSGRPRTVKLFWNWVWGIGGAIIFCLWHIIPNQTESSSLLTWGPPNNVYLLGVVVIWFGCSIQVYTSGQVLATNDPE